MLPFELTKDTPYLALAGELWSVFYEYFNRYWSCYKGFLLYNGTTLYFGLHSLQKWFLFFFHYRRTPLQCAAYGGFVNCMSVLIELQADPNAQDNEVN